MADISSQETRPSNRLAEETSPYLLQHKYNPVDWYPWSKEAFEKARQENALIFLSIGYSSCHWCHVMEHESFEDKEIADALNEHFVAIKVDREERPDIDGLYMDFVQRATGQGGWPLSVFLLPDGRPFYGGTYFPPDDRFGRPGFKRILETLSGHWTNDPDRLRESAREVEEGLQVDVMAQITPGELTPDHLEHAVATVAGQFDREHGGFGGAPKFPQAMVLSFLLHEYARSGNTSAREMALQTLDKMAAGGIYDHLGGGFHRYATDEEWLVPHFEKMLYDNAMLVRSYLEGYQLTGKERYQQVVEETLAYVQREMTNDEGGFYTAEDADSEGEEGKFYVWTYDQALNVLGKKEGPVVAAYFDISEDGNWEGKSILRRPYDKKVIAREFDQTVEAVQEIIEKGRGRLFEAREKRVRPERDDKVLTAWNGMMCSAFVEAYNVLGDRKYLEVAQRNANFLLERLYRAPDGVLLRTYKNGTARYKAFVEDYAYLAEALVALYEATGTDRWLEQAVNLTETMIAKFWDEEVGGFFFTAADTELIARRKEIMDNAMPAGNSVAIHLLLRLSVLLDRPVFRTMAEKVLKRLADPMTQQPTAFGYLLQALGLAVGPLKEVVLVGPERKGFLEVLHSRHLPHKIVVQADKEKQDSPLLKGRTPLGGQTTAYVCENYTCQQPVTNLEAFGLQIERA